MELLLRFAIGGVIVSSFAFLGDLFKPKSFAGLFGGAPSVALATLGIAILEHGRSYAALEARPMLAGAAALIAYALYPCGWQLLSDSGGFSCGKKWHRTVMGIPV